MKNNKNYFYCISLIFISAAFIASDIYSQTKSTKSSQPSLDKYQPTFTKPTVSDLKTEPVPKYIPPPTEKPKSQVQSFGNASKPKASAQKFELQPPVKYSKPEGKTQQQSPTVQKDKVQTPFKRIETKSPAIGVAPGKGNKEVGTKAAPFNVSPQEIQKPSPEEKVTDKNRVRSSTSTKPTNFKQLNRSDRKAEGVTRKPDNVPRSPKNISQLNEIFGRSPEKTNTWGDVGGGSFGSKGTRRPAPIEERDLVKTPYQGNTQSKGTSPGKSFERSSGGATGDQFNVQSESSEQRTLEYTSGSSILTEAEKTGSTAGKQRSVGDLIGLPPGSVVTEDNKEDLKPAGAGDIAGAAAEIQKAGGDPNDPAWWNRFEEKVAEEHEIPPDLLGENKIEDLLNAKGVIQGTGADPNKPGVWEGALGVVREGDKGKKQGLLDNFNQQHGSNPQSLDDMFGLDSGDGTGTGPNAGGTGGPDVDGTGIGSDAGVTGKGQDAGGTSTDFPDLSASGTHQAGEHGIPGGTSSSPEEGGNVGGETSGTQTDPGTGGTSEDPTTPTGTGTPQSGEGDPNAGWSGTADVKHNPDGSFTVTYTGYDENGNVIGSYKETYYKQEDGTYASEEGGTSNNKPEEDTYPLSKPSDDGVATADTSGSSSNDDTADSGSDDTDDSGSDDTADSGSDDTDDSGSDDTADSGSDDTDDSGSDDTADSGSDDTADSDSDGSGDAATPDPDGGARYTGPALTQKDMELMFKEYMQNKGMGVNQSPSELKEGANRLVEGVNPIDPYARPTDDSSGGSSDFTGFGNALPGVAPQETVKDQLDPDIEIETGRPGPQTGTGGEIPRN